MSRGSAACSASPLPQVGSIGHVYAPPGSFEQCKPAGPLGQSAWRSRRWRSLLSSPQLRQPPLEETPLRLLLGEAERPLVGGPGLRRSPEPPAEVGPRGVGQVVVGQLAAGQDASIRPSPASGPSRIATATARFSSTTGDGLSRAAARRRAPTICAQSVARGVGASACTAAIAACSVYGPNRRDDSARSTSAVPSAICSAVPQRAVLVVEQDQLAVRRGRAPRAATRAAASAPAGPSPRARAAARPAAGRAGSPRPRGRAA